MQIPPQSADLEVSSHAKNLGRQISDLAHAVLEAGGRWVTFPVHCHELRHCRNEGKLNAVNYLLLPLLLQVCDAYL